VLTEQATLLLGEGKEQVAYTLKLRGIHAAAEVSGWEGRLADAAVSAVGLEPGRYLAPLAPPGTFEPGTFEPEEVCRAAVPSSAASSDGTSKFAQSLARTDARTRWILDSLVSRIRSGSDRRGISSQT
jgi:hypothetical protein